MAGLNKETRAPLSTHLGSPHKLICKRLGALLQGVENESQGTGRIPQVEKLLKQQQAVSPLVRLSRRRHGLTFELSVKMLKLCDICSYALSVDKGCVSILWDFGVAWSGEV